MDNYEKAKMLMRYDRERVSCMTDEKRWAEEIALKICEKERVVAARSGEKIPYTTVNGIFDDNSGSDRIGWWTNGFYGGIMWLLYEKFCDDLFRQRAEGIEEKLDENLMQYGGMDHDSGFKWLPTSVMNYKLSGNKPSRNRALLAAANLAGRFNHAGRFIRAWNDWSDTDIGEKAGWAIIDCLMNLPLLYWAGNETKDPRFAQIAKMHADTAIKAFIREDGSVCHIVKFDPNTGERIGSLGGQGKEHGSSWTRGQAWAMYGFAMSYRFTKEARYLEAAKKVAAYVMNELEKWEFVPVDFWQDKELDWEDSTAAAIFACGLMELESVSREADGCEEVGLSENGCDKGYIRPGNENSDNYCSMGNEHDIKSEFTEKACDNESELVENIPGNENRLSTENQKNIEEYHNAAFELLEKLADHRCRWDTEVDNITEKCTAAYNDKEHNFSIIYGDYYFTEGILRLCGLKPKFLS